MHSYNELKKYTYMYLLNDSEEVQKLISAMLVIMYYNDKCIEKDNRSNYTELVSNSFIKACNQKIQFLKNESLIYQLNDIDKFKLLRDKIAHGDFVINPENGNFIIKIRNGEVAIPLEEEIETEIPQYSIIYFAEGVSNYYRFLNSDTERKTICIKDGIEYEFIDKPKGIYSRNNLYNLQFDRLIELVTSHRYAITDRPWFRNNRHLNRITRDRFEVKISMKETDKDNCIIINPDQKQIETSLINRIYNYEENYPYDEFVDSLIDFYRYYIYPLENFLKVEDKNIASLTSEKMFSFENLDIPKTENIKTIEDIGKVNSYNNDITIIINKLNNLESRKNSYESNPYFNDNQKIEKLKEEIDELLEILINDSVANSYNYNKNRSIVEIIRCAITHGSYDINGDKITFTDDWHDQNRTVTITKREFINMLNHNNKKEILKQYETVYQRKIYKK